MFCDFLLKSSSYLMNGKDLAGGIITLILFLASTSGNDFVTARVLQKYPSELDCCV